MIIQRANANLCETEDPDEPEGSEGEQLRSQSLAVESDSTPQQSQTDLSSPRM